MKDADTKILSEEVVMKCEQLCIEISKLKNSKRNVLAFTSNNHRNREFEIVFLSNKYRVSTRYVGYRNVMVKESDNISSKPDPDYRRITYYFETSDLNVLNQLILRMLFNGYTVNPKTESLDYALRR